MRVIPVAMTHFAPFAAEAAGYEHHDFGLGVRGIMDELAEFAGRNCYQAWERKNPATRTNEGYLANIINQGHFSVLEHASITFFVDGVSRALLTELERHRFLSFSVISQRYVMMNADNVVVPPAIENHAAKFKDWSVEVEFDQAIEDAFKSYDMISTALASSGLPKKQALEAARSVLPNATEVKMVVTGNLRAWRDVIGKRYHVAADAEIREFASLVLALLRAYAPNSVQDMPVEPFGTES